MLLLTWDSKIYSRLVHQPFFTAHRHFNTIRTLTPNFRVVLFNIVGSICVLCDISYNNKCLLMGFVSQSNSKLKDNNSAIRNSLLGILRAELHLESQKTSCNCHGNRKICVSGVAVDWCSQQGKTLHLVLRNEY